MAESEGSGSRQKTCRSGPIMPRGPEQQLVIRGLDGSLEWFAQRSSSNAECSTMRNSSRRHAGKSVQNVATTRVRSFLVKSFMYIRTRKNNVD